MRIDREAFLLAVAALAGCEQDTGRGRPLPLPDLTKITVQRPAIAAVTRLPVVVEPMPAPVPVVVPVPHTARRHVSPSKQWFFGLSMETRENVTNVCEERGHLRCQEALRRFMPPAHDEAEPIPEPVDTTEEKVASLPADKLAKYCKDEVPAPSCETPLVVAFDNQPVAFSSSSERFAFVPNVPMTSDWPTAATPWIALDLDGDGAITSGAELFGSSTAITGGHASNGFEALAALDANGDGKLDARDPMFAKLVLWSDRNGDHKSSPDEIKLLSDSVSSISLAFTHDARCNDRDDCEGERGTLHWRDALGGEHTGTVVDVYLPTK